MFASMPWAPTITYAPPRSAYWATQSKDADTIETESALGQPNCWRCQMRFNRTTPTGTREDQATVTLHITKNPGAGVRVRGITSELAGLETIIDAWVTAWQTTMSDAFSFVEYRWFNVDADDPLSDKGYPLHGPPVRVTAKSMVGTGAASRNADQVAASVTFKSASRKHWGRVYLPGPSRSFIDTSFGRFTSSYVDTLANSTRTMVNSLAGSPSGIYELGIWSPRGLAWLNLTSVQVDNVPDIIRRRRAKQASYFKRLTS